MSKLPAQLGAEQSVRIARINNTFLIVIVPSSVGLSCPVREMGSCLRDEADGRPVPGRRVVHDRGMGTSARSVVVRERLRAGAVVVGADARDGETPGTRAPNPAFPVLDVVMPGLP